MGLRPSPGAARAGEIGIILFQDQVVTLGIDVGGMTASASDQMRRAFQRRNNEALIKRYWERFRDGAAERGVAEKIEDIPKVRSRKATRSHSESPTHGVAQTISIAIASSSNTSESQRPDQCRIFFRPQSSTPANGARCPQDKGGAKTQVRGFNKERSLTLNRSGVQRAALENLVKAVSIELPGVTDRRQALWEVGLRYQASGAQGRLQLEVMQDMATLLERDRLHSSMEDAQSPCLEPA